MSRCTSAAMAKGKSRYKQDKPREGTNARQVYDLLMDSRGSVVEILMEKGTASAVKYMVDFYGLDIRRVKPLHWILAGEWDGKAYIDYTQPENR